jgi:predicted RNase H-like HicB family nuclease
MGSVTRLPHVGEVTTVIPCYETVRTLKYAKIAFKNGGDYPMNISVRIEIFKEGDVYVALSPELNVSSFGETIDDAKKSFKEALEAFIEECQEMGTLEEVLEESGFSKINNSWESRKPLVEENLALAM